MRPWWIGWVGPQLPGGFEYRGPWWVSGYQGDGRPTFCAAVLAPTEIEAKRVVLDAYGPATVLEWRFAREQREGWRPFCPRFPRADWMVWPT